MRAWNRYRPLGKLLVSYPPWGLSGSLVKRMLAMKIGPQTPDIPGTYQS